MQRGSVPFEELDAVFFDAGNTLLCWDHDFVAEQARAAGFSLDPVRLARTEAAARPLLDALLGRGRSTEAPDTVHAYLECMLAAGLVEDLSAEERSVFAARLAPSLRGARAGDRLWSRVPPGLPESLARLRQAGLTLVVVSNSDGSIERKLREAGLADYFHDIVDSAHVGVEKPDPGIFQHALSRCRHAPARALHVGDLYAIDVVGARRAGLHAVLVDPHDDWRDVDCIRFPDVPALAQAILSARAEPGELSSREG